MKTKELTLMALMLALLIVCSQLTIPIGPVPITLQTFAVLLIGFLLTPKQAMITTTSYVLLGLIGFPIFAGFKGGIHSLTSPAFGFILSFIIASVVLSLLTNKTRANWKINLIAGIMASLIIYAIGLSYMAYVFNTLMGLNKSFSEILTIGMTPFLIGDSIKLFVATIVASRLYHPLVKKFIH